jgi:hypothetical protein
MRAWVAACALACAAAVPAMRHAAAQLPACPFRGAPSALAERASPLDSVTLRLGDGVAKLCYGRPSAAGRPKVGVEFPFGAPWQLGENEPTTLHVDFPARLGSVDLEPGSYSLYVIPEAGDWTVVVNGNPSRWGLPIDAEVRAADLGSFALTPASVPEYVDRLTFRFEAHGATEGALVYAWERTSLIIPLTHR